MYHLLRNWHKWIGVAAALILALLSVTGFLLATKGTFGWIRPPEGEGGKVEHLREVITLDQAAEAAYKVGLPELKTAKDIDRIDYRPKSNVFKVVSKRGYHEVQVDGATGIVIQIARRNDQLAEDIHDLSFFADAAHQWVLPASAIALAALSVSGVVMFFVPVVRRAKFRKKQKQSS
jgi:uncharacterized iron-regulated membrane protein